MSSKPAGSPDLVVFGLLGTVKDDPSKDWRPSLEICQQLKGPGTKRFILLFQNHRRDRKLAEAVASDISGVVPDVEVCPTPLSHKFHPWRFDEVYAALLAFARSYPFDEDREQYLVSLATGTDVAKIALFLLTERRAFPAQLVQAVPPADGRPADVVYVDLADCRYAALSGREEIDPGQQSHPLGGDIQWGPTFTGLLNDILEVGRRLPLPVKDHPMPSPLLLTGPTGAGKSFIARKLYEAKFSKPSDRQCGPGLQEVNCATLRGDLLSSILFGHTAGAFTGAVKDVDGLISSANEGMLFLDEIGDLPAEAQAMLLTVLDTGRFRKLGTTKSEESRFQLVAATSRDLVRDVTDRPFREDLYYRISDFVFRVPGLRERPDDLEPFLDFATGESQRDLGLKLPVRFDPDARRFFLSRARMAEWHGNLREFRQMVMRAASKADNDGRIRYSVVADLWKVAGKMAGVDPACGESEDGLLAVVGPEQLREIDRFDRVQLSEVIRVCRNAESLAEAGRFLFDRSRERKRSLNDSHRLAQYLKRFRLNWERIRKTTAC